MKSRESCLQSEKVNPVILQKKKKKKKKKKDSKDSKDSHQ